jgi:hypothetical protein
MTKIRSIVYPLCLIAAIALVSRPVSASILYTTLVGSSYDTTNGGVGVNGSNYNNQVIGQPFTLGAGATVGDAVLALGNLEGSDNPVNVYIESDSVSGLPGVIISQLSQVGTILPWSNGSRGGLVTFTCSVDCTLGAGSYWLVALETDSASFQAWDWAFGDPSGPQAYNFVGSPTGPWIGPDSSTEAAFQIDGSTIPEPGSLILLGSGLLGFAGVVRRRRTS